MKFSARVVFLAALYTTAFSGQSYGSVGAQPSIRSCSTPAGDKLEIYSDLQDNGSFQLKQGRQTCLGTYSHSQSDAQRYNFTDLHCDRGAGILGSSFDSEDGDVFMGGKQFTCTSDEFQPVVLGLGISFDPNQAKTLAMDNAKSKCLAQVGSELITPISNYLVRIVESQGKVAGEVSWLFRCSN